MILIGFRKNFIITLSFRKTIYATRLSTEQRIFVLRSFGHHFLRQISFKTVHKIVFRQINKMIYVRESRRKCFNVIHETVFVGNREMSMMDCSMTYTTLISAGLIKKAQAHWQNFRLVWVKACTCFAGGAHHNTLVYHATHHIG